MMTMSRTIAIVNLGRIPYRSAWQIQSAIRQTHLNNQQDRLPGNGVQDVLILCEHAPVYTVGIRTKDYPKQDEERLKSLGSDFVRTNRGGLITFHGPGQLVAYPIINLKNYSLGLRHYVCALERVLIQTCAGFGLQAKTTADTGVWVGERKIAAIGISCKRYITQHGISLNCTTDLSWFDHIVPCGLEGKGVTSLSQECRQRITVEETEPIFVKVFCDVFNCSVVDDYEFDKKHWMDLQ